MSASRASFADLSFDEVLDQWRSINSTTRDGLIIFITMTMLVGVIFLWAAFVRKPKRRQHSHHHHSHHHSAQEKTVASSSENVNGEGRKRRKWRRQRREHRPRNPTLAETGGLPPARRQGPSDPQF